MTAWYNEIAPYCAEWLRNLIAAGEIPPGDVDERPIEEVSADDVRPYTQCHFFAGLGGWGYATRLAGWPDDRPLWTGSCPCQFASSAARGRNPAADLWPEWRRLIAAVAPRVVFGEQVPHARHWFNRVCDDMEGMGYTIGAAVLPAVSVAQDHERMRIYFAGHADNESEPGVPVNGEVARVQGPGCNAEDVVLTDGVSFPMAAMRPFGNAIVPQVAAEFLMAFTEAREAGVNHGD